MFFADSLSPERKKVIKAACSLVGKVNYFWGGKSSAIGWDSEWGKLKTVSAEGSKMTVTSDGLQYKEVESMTGISKSTLIRAKRKLDNLN